MHGLRAALTGWERASRAELSPAVTSPSRRFPFAHTLASPRSCRRGDADDHDDAHRGSAPVPIAFGYHPFLTLPGVPRAQWGIALPVDEHLPSTIG